MGEEIGKMSPLPPKQLAALRMAARGPLISAHGNEFFISGMTDAEGTCQRNTLEALSRKGLTRKAPDMTGRGRYVITEKGKEALSHGKQSPSG